MNKYEELWQKILYDLEHIFNEEIYSEVFEPIKRIWKIKNGVVFAIAKDDFSKNRINLLYINKIDELANKYSKEPVRFRFITENEMEPEENITMPEKNISSKYLSGNINATYSFDNYVTGKCNLFAFKMAMQVANQPGIVANPLYIFGDVGLGKTHLMQAIGNFILESDAQKKLLYVKTDNFIEDFVNLLRKNKMDEFNQKYREIDVLLVDDIQIFGGSNKTQTEFFKVFEYMHGLNKQIVITSDKPASLLKDIMPRLTSRFEAGLSVDLGIPDLEHRVSILNKKLITDYPNSISIKDDVLYFIANSFQTNIRELEGALKRVLYYCLANNIEVTIESASEALDQILKTKTKSYSLSENGYDKIQSIVSEFYRISIADLVGKSRAIKYTIPRHIAMYLIKENYNIPYKTIGELFGGRSHSTVLLACEKLEHDLKLDNALKKALESISKKINFNNKAQV